MARAGLSTNAVVAAAIDVIDESGAGALTFAAVAQRCGVATPSLYKHVSSLAELHTRVGVSVLDDMTRHLTSAVLGHSGHEAVAILMRSYRAYVVAHPGRYSAMPVDPLHDPDLADAGARLLEVILAVLRGQGLTGSAAIHATRTLRVIAHGFASIETAGGFGLPEDLDETYEHLIRMFLATL